MIESFKSSLTKYADFNGRATRYEYWTCYLFFYISTFLAGLLGGLVGIDSLGGLVVVGLVIPGLACGVRRMHDVGKSGWFLLIPIYNFVLLVSPTKQG